MNRRMLLMGIMTIVLLFVTTGNAFAFGRELVADLGDVRIFHIGRGHFIIESERIQQSLPLTFRQIGGWIEIACSSEVVRVTAGQIGSGVQDVVTKALAPLISPFASYLAGRIAGQVASWASRQSIDFLCGN